MNSICAANQRFDLAAVKLFERGVGFFAEARKRRCSGVLLRLCGRFRAGNNRTHRFKIQNPAQGLGGKRRAVTDTSADFFGELDALFKRHAGESFSGVEGFAVSVERAVVVGSEAVIFAELAG